jgi:hypothetical protein
MEQNILAILTDQPIEEKSDLLVDGYMNFLIFLNFISSVDFCLEENLGLLKQFRNFGSSQKRGTRFCDEPPFAPSEIEFILYFP